MNYFRGIKLHSILYGIISVFLITLLLVLPEKDAHGRSSQPFQPGEVLLYDISWSNTLKAGTAVMEVEENRLPDGRRVFDFVLTGRSAGVVDKVFPIYDRVRSVFDPVLMHSLTYTISENYGKKKRQRSMVFDRERNVVMSVKNDQEPRTSPVPPRTQDGLAALYYLRTMTDFSAGNVFVIDVHDNGKNWNIEVHTLGKERVKTPAGEFDTIVVKTRPLLEGVFQNKGEVLIWLTDDNRKVPVLMKSRIKAGSFVFTLTGLQPGIAQQAANTAVVRN